MKSKATTNIIRLDPKVIFCSSDFEMAWDKTEITVAEYDGKWYNGISCPGMNCGCSIVDHRCFESEEEAIEDAYTELRVRLSSEHAMDLGFKHNGKKQLQELLEWWANKNNEQLKLF